MMTNSVFTRKERLSIPLDYIRYCGFCFVDFRPLGIKLEIAEV